MRKLFPLFLALIGHFLFALITPPSLFALTINEKLLQGKTGDFILVEVANNYSLLIIRSCEEAKALFEEVTVPAHKLNLSKQNLHDWLQQGAPGHTSWVMYEVDLKANRLIAAFSFSEQGWLHPGDSDYFLAKLLALPLEKIPTEERKRIGPPSKESDEDRRPLWNPPVTFDGKKIKSARCDVWRGRWPDDGSRLAGCLIDLYFAQDRPLFSFPLWIEIKVPHYTFKLRSADAGSNLFSPQKGLPPHRPRN